MHKFTGVLEPGKESLVDIYFEPQFAGYVTYNLIFKITSNPDEYVVPVEGYGLSPTLKISHEEIIFDACLPYEPNCFKTFNIQNISPFPIEFYFSDYDT